MASGTTAVVNRALAWATARSRPIEGWSIVLFHALIMAVAASVVARSEWVEVPTALALVAALGALVGLFLAKTHCPDVVAHLTATLLGIWIITFEVVTLYPELGVGRRERLAALIERARTWYRSTTSGNQQDDQILFVFVLAFTLWLVAYLSAWTLFRRRWLLVSLLLPAFLVLVMLGYSPEMGTWPLIILLLLSGVLSARYFAFRRQQVWSRFRIPAPQGLPWRFLGIGSNLVVVILLLAWTLPVTTETDAFADLRDRFDGPAGAVTDWWFDAVPDLSGDGGAASSTYASFGDSFELGGALDLGDQPALALRGVEGPQYLVGLRYDAYTGRGWESDVRSTFDPVGPDGTTYSPQLTFRPQQEVSLSDSIRTETIPIGGAVTILRPKGELLLTVDTYLRSDLATSVQLSWIQLDDVAFDLGSDDRAALPTDLRGLASLLLSADEFDEVVTQGGESPMPVAPDLAVKVRAEREQLTKRFLDTRWQVDDDGTVTIFVTGQLPAYDDVEAIFARDTVVEGATYEVVGLESIASSTDLREAGTTYPAYVTDRYLQLPESVTPRTLALATSLAGEFTNPFDIAFAIESEVRSRIDYSLDIDPPPSGQDVVDYVLFESRIGYCEYHSSAMAILLRAAGIPARVAVGYHEVGFDPAAQAYVYKESDAHAWVEVFFPGYGWIPFEPTPSESRRDYGSRDLNASPAPTPFPTAAPERTPDAAPTPTEVAVATPTPAVPALNVTNDGGPGRRGWIDWVPWVVVAVVAVGAGGVWFRWSMPFRGLSPAGTLLRQIVRLGGWLGVRGDPTMTPDEYAAELGRVAPAAQQPARYVAELYAVERYGGQSPSAAQARAGQRALRIVRRSLVRSLVWRRRSREGPPHEH